MSAKDKRTVGISTSCWQAPANPYHVQYSLVFVQGLQDGVFLRSHYLALQKECQIIEGHVMLDHVHLCSAIPPKVAVAQGIGFLKGKRAMAIARQFGGKERTFTGEHCWARGSAVSTVGFALEQVRASVRKQDDEDPDEGASSRLPC